MSQILIATKNKGKVAEFQKFFSQFQIECISLLNVTENFPDIQEIGTTFTENAQLKAEAGASFFNRPVIADDSGLIIDALNGRPGIHSARYAGEQKSDEDNMDKVLHELTGIKMEKRTARFIAVLAIAVPGERTIFRKGYCEGLIAYEKAGTEGFGYDPIFIPKGYTKTMAQLSSEEKNRISHRSHAFKQLEQWMNKTNILANK